MKRPLTDLLAEHADALNREDDMSDWLADNSLLANAASVLTLLQLAQAVKRVLIPVAPSPLFQADLKGRLLAANEIAVGKRPFPTTIVLGTAVSVIGLTLYLLHRFQAADDGVVTAG